MGEATLFGQLLQKMTIFSNINFSKITLFHSLLLYISYFNNIYAQTNSNQMHIPVPVPVRVIVDRNSSFGSMVNLCMDMAILDFYSSHSNYETRLQLINKDAKDTLDLNLAVVELVKHEEVLAILGSRGSVQQDIFAAAVGEAALVPIVSFTARSSALSYTQNSYFLRTSLDDAVEAEALAAICGRFGWSEAVIFYEDTLFGNQFLSHTIKAFQDVDIKLTYMAAIPLSAEDSHIKLRLSMMNAEPTRVFLVHMNPLLGSRLFALANDVGMMSRGYAWIVTDSISIFLNSISSETRVSMDGVVGIRPHVMASKNLKSFHQRWKRNTVTDSAMDLNIYGLWAYDTVTALAIAVENIKPIDSSFGPRLVSELSKTKFQGLAGDFELDDGKLKTGAYEIFNIIGSGERTVGFWSRERGITREVREGTDSKSKDEMRKIFWPGDSVIQPTGWSIPPTGSLRVGIPWRSGFIEFVDVMIDPATNETRATGFAVDVFVEAVQHLPFPVTYTFHFDNDSSGQYYLNSDVGLPEKFKEFDIVVADVTIWLPRAEHADFSQPYSESRIVLVVKNKKPFDMWIFIRPLRWDLWLAIVVSSMLIGVVLCIMENRGSENSGAIYLSPIAVLAFQDRNMVSNKWSVFVLVCWLFMAFILMQCFTANLSAILTLDQLKFSFSEDYYVGYQEGSFMKTFLTENLHINETSLRSYSSVEGFHDGMSKGSKNGGIDAIFDELPYMKLLMNRYKSQYRIVGPSYHTGGFGFVFPPGSPLTQHFSKAILNVTQGPTMSYLEGKNFGPGYSSQDPLSSVISQGTSSLTLREFAGLFFVTGSFVLFALFCSTTSIGRRLTQTTQRFIPSCFSNRTPSEHSTELSSFVGDDGSHDSAPDNGGAPPLPPGEGGDADAPVVGDEAADISERAQDGESNTAQNAGGIENEEHLAHN